MPNKNPFKIKKIRKFRKKKETKPLIQITQWLKYVGIAVITIALMFVVYETQKSGDWFKASVLDLPQPFNGTVLPIAKVPDWSNWTGDHYTIHYNEIPENELIDIPAYNVSLMQFPDNQLEWGNPNHDIIRNTKITYPVVYMGNYEYDHQEQAGSHLAIDIRVPVGTPIHTIANGKVVKTSMQSTGFGHHIVIKHINVPDPNNPNKTTTLYSSYVHMDEINVKEGQNVLKGDIIGTSGNTGTSTTPHLHFQVDNDDAPWHPYWPFTWQEAQDAGLDFFSAINAGLGKSTANQYTLNPMMFVTQYIGAYTIVSDQPGGTDNTNNNTSDDEVVDDGVEIIDNPFEDTNDTETEDPEIITENPEPATSNKIDTSLFEFELSGEKVSLAGNGITIYINDKKHQIDQLNNTDEIPVDVTGVGSARTKKLSKSDFSNHSAKVIINSSEVGESNVQIGKSSMKVNFIDQVQGIAGFRIDHDGKFQKNRVEVVEVVAIDSNGNPTPSVAFSGVVSLKAKTGDAKFSPEVLEVQDFKNGIATVRMTVASENSIVVRAQNGALVGESTSISIEDDQVFTDVPRSHENYAAIKYLKDEGIINGYSDGTFRPEATVNRVEALKMLMYAFGVEAGPAKSLPFSDTENNAWYAAPLATAIEKGIVKGYADGTFKPAQTVKIAEYIKILFETNDIEMTDTLAANPYADVPKDEWYASYAYLLNRKNLLDVSNNRLYPANGMTRGDVAETIYRLKYVLDNNLVSYSN